MKNILNTKQFWSLLTISIVLFGCDPDFIVEEPGEYTFFYMPQAKTGANAKTLVMVDSVQSITYGAAYGGPYLIKEDVTVEFEVVESLVGQYNEENGTNYPLIPASSYEFESKQVVVPSGSLASTPLKININPGKGFEFETAYLLPVSIKSVSGNHAINESKKITYFLIDANPPVYEPFVRTGWTIKDVSSEELVGEGANNGNAIHALDGAIGTFWHTKWSGGTDPMPHHITIDMGEVKTVNGFSFVQRQNRSNGNVKDISIELSVDGDSWVEGSIFPSFLPSNNSNNPIFLRSSTEARYFRVNIVSTYGDTQFTHFAEIYGF
ncbi:BT_3987 domain-containing protein [Belliella marina]|uniref:BT_3987 domain-containing protein n=1 Tax=Belliella marina TaxID=1644146 RepID=A0ABW4VVM9_9BACT